MTFLGSIPAAFFALLALPVAIHLLNRLRVRRRRWAAMSFLTRALKRTRRRFRFQDLIVLLLRAAIVGAFLFAMLRPRVAPDGVLAALVPEGSRHLVILFDDSASMAAPGPDGRALTEAAKDAAVALIASLKTGDAVTVVAATGADHGDDAVPDFSTNFSAAAASLARWSPGAGRARAAPALTIVTRLLEQPRAKAFSGAEVHYFTDAQAADWGAPGSGQAEASARALAALAAAAGGKTRLHVFNAAPASATGNRALTAVAPVDRIAGVGVPCRVRVEARRYGEAAPGVEPPAFRWRAGSRPWRTGSLRLTEGAAGDEGRLEGEFLVVFDEVGPHDLAVELAGEDDLPFDDRRAAVITVVDELPVLGVDGDPDGEPERGLFRGETGYFRLAVGPAAFGGDSRKDDAAAGGEPRAAGRLTPVTVTTVTPDSWSPADLERYRLIVVANVPRLDPGPLAALERYAASGGTVVFFCGDRVDAEFYNRFLYRDGAGILPAAIGPPRTPEDDKTPRPRLDRPDHPLLAPLAGEDLAPAVAALRVDRWLSLTLPPAPGEKKPPAADADARGTIRLISLDAATEGPRESLLLEKPFGRGAVLLCATSLDVEWGSLPIWPLFPTFAGELVSYAAQRGAATLAGLVGEPLTAPLSTRESLATCAVRTPAGDTRPAQTLGAAPASDPRPSSLAPRPSAPDPR
ncbi:MAG: BatA domain-containing protein, partial [Planctomycetes bacterium]|nr:BatA domain-containing protein [Planctomycetota bacterium]